MGGGGGGGGVFLGGGGGAPKSSSTGESSTICPRYMTAMRSEMYSTTERLWVMKM